MKSKKEILPLLPMRIKVKPYQHQVAAFNFVCHCFSLIEGGGARDSMKGVICKTCGKPFLKATNKIRENNFCCNAHANIWKGKWLAAYNRSINPMNKPGGILASRIKRSRESQGSGEGKAYKKLLGRHEHRRIAEALIGRPLRNGEVVHHIDGNKQNNSPINLEVLPSRKDHVKRHPRDEKGRWCR